MGYMCVYAWGDHECSGCGECNQFVVLENWEEETNDDDDE